MRSQTVIVLSLLVVFIVSGLTPLDELNAFVQQQESKLGSSEFALAYLETIKDLVTGKKQTSQLIPKNYTAIDDIIT
jgi:hypothetical protein